MTLSNNIPNLSLVDRDRNIYRSGQPKDSSAWDYIRSLGIRNVIKLNTEPGDESSGLIVEPYPITTPQQIWGPVKGQLESALAAITNDTLIHCELGENRTGTLVILYRVKICAWTKELAIAEAKNFEWEWSLPALQLFVSEL